MTAGDLTLFFAAIVAAVCIVVLGVVIGIGTSGFRSCAPPDFRWADVPPGSTIRIDIP